MNLLSLIIIFLAVVICGAIAFIAWELTDLAGESGDDGTSADADRDPPADD